MATRNIKLTGPVRWAKVFEENRDMNGFEGAYQDHDGGYTIELGLTAEQMKELKATGSMKKGREEEDGLTWVKFLRKHSDRFEWASGAPKVTDSMGNLMEFEDGPIGNGSEAEVSLSVYDTSRKSIKGTRLDEVKVLRKFDAPKKEDSIPF